MDYKDVAKVVIRSPQTVRKWCPKITALSGYTFDFEIQRRRNGERKIPHFTKEDLTKFKALRQALALSGNFEQSVFKVYGNLKAKREREIFNEIDEVGQNSYDRFKALSEKVSQLQKENSKLAHRVYKLEHFNSRLEKLEIGLRKNKIKDLLNEQFKN
ncbi:MAG: hypothetical protein ACFWTQ_04955 [Lactococcus sp.]|jgi:ABC-type oligopeptide transport system substrate-binding subunit